tara:strand:+ start:431 stop:910 length:480 start_codon:yes stop_codon:yes gene_type:complete
MPQYRNRETGDVLSSRDIKKTHSNISFSSMVNTFDDIGYDLVLRSDAPAPSSIFKQVRGGGAVQNDNNEWVQEWVEVDMFSGATKAADEAAHSEQLDIAAAESARAKRDSRLALTDFHGLTDMVMSEAMTTYRQALRDVPEQLGFPGEITWPVSPVNND